MAEEIIKARVWTKVDTLENWNNNPMLLGPGEMALVTTPSGIPLNMKWGDKNERKRFSDLPFVISYDQGQFVAIDGPGEMPTPESDVAYSLVGPGTYTYPGQADIVVDDGRWGQVVYNGGEWSLVDMGELPEVQGKDVLNPTSDDIPTSKAIADYTPSKRFLGIVEFKAGENISPILEASYLTDDTVFESGFIRTSGTIGASSTWMHTKEYQDILPGTYVSNMVLSGNSAMVVYDKNYNIIQTFTNQGVFQGTSDWSMVVVDGARYYKTSRASVPPTDTVDLYIKSSVNLDLVTQKTFVTPDGLDVTIKEEFTKRGFISISEGDNLLSELTNSDLNDTSLWAEGFLHYNGSIMPAETYRYSVKKYPVYKGNYNLGAYFTGNSRLWIFNSTGDIVRMIENTGETTYDQNIEILDGESFIQLSCNIASGATSFIKLNALEDIYYFDAGYVPSEDLDLRDIYKAQNEPLAIPVGVVTFISDDGALSNDWYLDVLSEYKVKSGFAIIGSRLNGHITSYTREQVMEKIHDQGHEIMNHTVSHDTNNRLATLDEPQLYYQLMNNKMILQSMSNDVKVKFVVSPWGSRNALVDKVARVGHLGNFITRSDSLITSGEIVNMPNLESFNIKRASFDASADGVSRLQICKDAVDQVVATGGWLVFAIHPQYGEYEDTNPVDRKQELRDLLQYIADNNISVLTPTQAFETYGNRVELGYRTYSEKWYSLGSDNSEQGNYFV